VFKRLSHRMLPADREHHGQRPGIAAEPEEYLRIARSCATKHGVDVLIDEVRPGVRVERGGLCRNCRRSRPTLHLRKAVPTATLFPCWGGAMEIMRKDRPRRSRTADYTAAFDIAGGRRGRRPCRSSMKPTALERIAELRHSPAHGMRCRTRSPAVSLIVSSDTLHAAACICATRTRPRNYVIGRGSDYSFYDAMARRCLPTTRRAVRAGFAREPWFVSAAPR